MYYEVCGLTDELAPTLVFSSGLGGSARFWLPQMPALTKHFRVIVYDHNGTGRSPAKLPKAYSIAHMAEELAGLLDDLGVKRCHLIGHALGGLIGLQLALQRPQMLQSMLLVNAWSSPNPHTQRCFAIRKSILANCSEDVYLQMQALMLYPPDWIAENIQALEQEEAHMKTHFPDKANLLARIQALCECDLDAELPSIFADTLVIANKDDALIPWQCSQVLAERLPKAKLQLLDYGGHASSVTVPAVFNDILLSHLFAYRDSQVDT